MYSYYDRYVCGESYYRGPNRMLGYQFISISPYESDYDMAIQHYYSYRERMISKIIGTVRRGLQLLDRLDRLLPLGHRLRGYEE